MSFSLPPPGLGGSPTGIIIWEEALRGVIVYNLLQSVVVLFFFILYRLYYHPIVAHWHNIHKNPKSRSTLLHCITITPALSCTSVYYPLRTYQYLGVISCYSLTLLLARFVILGQLRHAPKMLHITTLGALDPQFLDLSKPIYLAAGVDQMLNKSGLLQKLSMVKLYFPLLSGTLHIPFLNGGFSINPFQNGHVIISSPRLYVSFNHF